MEADTSASLTPWMLLYRIPGRKIIPAQPSLHLPIKNTFPFAVLMTVALTGCIKERTISGSAATDTPVPERPVESAKTQATPAAINLSNQAVAPEAVPEAEVSSGVDNTPQPPAIQAPPPRPLVGRIWTSTDGRTIAAELLSRTSETVTIRRNEDRQEFTIPLRNLSAKDQAYVKNSGLPVTVVKQFDAEKLARLKRNIPPLNAHPPLDASYATLVDFHSRYKRKIEFISETGFERHIQMLRQEMESDLKRFQPVASTSLSSAPTFNRSTNTWSGGSGAWKDAWAARSITSWLQGPLERHVDELEQLK